MKVKIVTINDKKINNENSKLHLQHINQKIEIIKYMKRKIRVENVAMER